MKKANLYLAKVENKMQKQKIVQKIDPDILQFLKVRKEVPVNTMII